MDLLRYCIGRPNVTGGHTGAVPPKRKLCPPPKRGLCPEEINRLGAIGVQIEAEIFVFSKFTWHSWDEDLFFFLEITCFGPEKPLKSLISAGKSLRISVKTFFLQITCFGPEKSFEFLISAGKSLWISCSFDPDWDKFLVPPCPSRIHINKLIVHPQNWYLPPPPVTLSWRRASA